MLSTARNSKLDSDVQEIVTDVAIIGAGPVGLFSVFQLGMLGMKCVVIDALDSIGGQCSALYPEKPIYDIPAYPEISAQGLIDNLHAQISPFEPQFILSDLVESISRASTSLLIETKKGRLIKSKAIILANGCGAFGPNRPPIDGIESFEDKSVFYSIKNVEIFRGKNIVIAGGGDSAVDWAVELAKTSNKIFLVHRRDKFRAADAMVSKMLQLVQEGRIDLVTPYQLSALNGQNGILNSVEVIDLDGNQRLLDADYMLSFFGLKMDVGPMLNWGLKLNNNHVLVDPASMQTSENGIFAIGDIADYPGKLKLILTGFSESAIAAHNIYKIIFPEKALHFEYSTTKGVPGS